MEFFEILAASLSLQLTLAMIVGLCIGSFLNVVGYRLPIILRKSWLEDCQNMGCGVAEDVATMSLLSPPSKCSVCSEKIKWYDNIPLLGWILLAGKCRSCKAKISISYPLVELITGLLSVAVVYKFGFTFASIVGLMVVWMLISIVLIDLKHFMIPDELSLPLLWVGLLFNAVSGWVTLESAVFGAAICYLSFWSLFWVFRLILKKDALGYGDFKMFAALGALFGVQSVGIVLLVAGVSGLILAIVTVNTREQSGKIPFGPGLAVAGISYMLSM